MEGIEITGTPYIVEDINTKAKYLIFPTGETADLGAVTGPAIMIIDAENRLKEIQLENKKITVLIM